MLESGGEHEEFKADQLGKCLAAQHVPLESTLEPYHGENGPDGHEEFKSLDLGVNVSVITSRPRPY